MALELSRQDAEREKVELDVEEKFIRESELAAQAKRGVA